ncbi:MAG: hypothetical protein M0R77_01020 [Gammaproteobacteria bacterium]|nr:hypothetical protein [Acholeplasmataceae bacterium]MCK9529137.1 hypothetical protein [Gammaproteobacteria bacterium]
MSDHFKFGLFIGVTTALSYLLGRELGYMHGRNLFEEDLEKESPTPESSSKSSETGQSS